ncbi:ANTAR domain-containing protein [Streptomyces sp. PmtG]
MPEAAQSAVTAAHGRTHLADAPGEVRLSELTVDTRPEGARVAVAVRGTLDLVTDQRLRQALRAALTRSAQGVDVDLSGVGFCDCCGLNTLLTIRQQALDEGKTATISGISPAAARVFTLSDTLSLFTLDDTYGQGDGDVAADPRVELVQLRRAMRTRGAIDIARGILMAVFTLSEAQAWDVLVMTSQNTNTKLHTTAQQLTDSVQGGSLPEATQEQLSAAVAHATAPHGRRRSPR